jgi:serine/threonine protein kinase
MSLENGRVLGPYEILEPAGAGGMGEVYKARDTRLDRTVAIKVLPASVALNADLKARFEREAKAISSLNHPNICTLYDIGKVDGVEFLVMEFLEGESLSDRLKKGPLQVNDVYEIAIEVCDALDKAHRQGLIHRDLKPGNIMLTAEGAKLLDFGLAKLRMTDSQGREISQITQTTPLTGTGTILGTLQYMAPEQLEGAEADARSDIFSFGVVLYEMLTGLKAFEGKSQASLIAGIMGQEPTPVGDIKPMTPPGLSRVVKKCIEKQPDNRWQSARDLADELRWISRSGSQAGIPLSVSARRKFKFDLARAVGLLAILAALGLGYLYYAERSKEIPVTRTNILLEEGSRLANFAGGSLAISPDGTKLAYVARDSSDNSFKVWVRLLNSLTAYPLKGTDGASFPFWSPDGEQIGFFSSNKLKKTLASGGPVLTLCDVTLGRPACWNKQDIILFTPDYKGPLYKVAAAGGEPSQVTALDSVQDDFTHRYPRFLPDDDHFLFFIRHESNDGGERDELAVSSLSDTSITRLFFAKSNVAYANGYLLFVRESILMAQPFDVSSRTLEESAVPIAEQVSFNKPFSRGVFAVSDNGDLVYRRGEVKTGSTFILYSNEFKDVDTVGELQEFGTFALSHDNAYLAAEIEDPQTSGSDIWIYELQRGIKRRFTFNDKASSFPFWSPDDSALVFSSNYNDTNGLYIKDAYGTKPPQLLVASENPVYTWGWSRDGKYILYGETVPGTQSDLKIYTFGEDSAVTDYLATPFREGTARISPDGRWLAYTSNESGQFELYVSTFPTYTVKWQVSTKGGAFPKWSEDGTLLYFAGADDNIQVAEVDGSGRTFRVNETRILTNMKMASWPLFEVFNDNKRFVVSQPEEGTDYDEIVFVYNWPGGLR